MKKDKKIKDRLLGFFDLLYVKLFLINDTRQRVAAGLGLGVFSGIFPGTGPIAALFLASCLRANRASALLGSLLTNTWLSIVTFLLSIKVGSVIMRVNWQEAQRAWFVFLKDFRWINLVQISALKIIFPALLGYLVIASCLGLLSYLVALIIIISFKSRTAKKRGIAA